MCGLYLIYQKKNISSRKCSNGTNTIVNTTSSMIDFSGVLMGHRLCQRAAKDLWAQCRQGLLWAPFSKEASSGSPCTSLDCGPSYRAAHTSPSGEIFQASKNHSWIKQPGRRCRSLKGVMIQAFAIRHLKKPILMEIFGLFLNKMHRSLNPQRFSPKPNS